jgi:hypothetical protein
VSEITPHIQKKVDAFEPQLFNDHFQNFKRYNIPKAQLIITDIPYNIGNNAYASNPAWYTDGDNTNGESELSPGILQRSIRK